MKKLTTLLTSTFVASVVLAGTAQAEALSDDALYNLIHPESADIFNVVDYKRTTEASIFSLNDDYNKDSVWSFEFEQYVDTDDFKTAEIADSEDVNQYINSNPTAAGLKSQTVFIYNETAGEYHLQ